MSKLIPKYTVWDVARVTLAVAMRALEEIRTLARTPGPCGKDGLGWDDLEEELADDGRTIIRRYKRGDQVKEFRHTFPVMLYRGVFHDGKNYVKGDCVTWGGSQWVALKGTGAKPGEGLDWQLSVKRGRDGKEVVTVPRDPSTPVKINGPAHS